MNAMIRSLKTEQDVVTWLASIVTKPPPQIPAEKLIGSVGAKFKYCASNETKRLFYSAALDCVSADNFNKERMQIPFIKGAPGVGKTRMLIESLNILKECARESIPEERILTSKLNQCSILLYATFGSGNAISQKDSEFFSNFNHAGIVAFRLLWRYYLRSTFDEITQMQITPELAKYLTLQTLIESTQEVGVGHIVLAIDEMNMLHDASKDHFRLTVQSISSVLLNKHKNVFVAYAGLIHSPLRQTISTLGVPLSILPEMLSLSDIAKILDDLENTFLFLKGWRHAGAFRRCVAYLANPPRLLDYLIEEISKNIKIKPMKNVFTLDYEPIMAKVVEKADAKSGKAWSLGVKDAKKLIELSLLKKIVDLNYELPSGETIEDRQRQGFIFWSKANGPSRQIAIPLYYLNTFLQLNNDPNYKPFEPVRNFFKFSRQDEHTVTPHSAWENFNVKFTSFKLTMMHGATEASFSLAEFHSGAMLGSELPNIKVVPRVTFPCKFLGRYPTEFSEKHVRKPSSLVSSMIDESVEVPLWSAVCLNGKNVPGIDSFFWLSDKVIELQQLTANENDAKPLTQKVLDEEYSKAEKLFESYLKPDGYSFVFGLISNRICSGTLILKPNMYVVHKSNMEEYYGPSFAPLALLRSEFNL